MRNTTSSVARFIAVVAVAAALTACTSAGGTNDDVVSTDGLPEVVELVSINPVTGVLAYAGEGANNGYKLAIEEINDSDFLEGTKIEVVYRDTATDAQTAAQETTQAIASSASVLLGSVSSAEAVAMAPISQKGEIPVVFTQAGSEGVVIGDYTYRIPVEATVYYQVISDYIEETGAKTVGVVYLDANPTMKELGVSALPEVAEKLGVEIVASVATQATTQDYSAPIQQVLRAEPELISMNLVGAANSTFMTQLRQAGYEGPVVGSHSSGTGNLDAAGEAGYGVVWPVSFHYELDLPATAEFVAAYEAKYGEEPTQFAAEAYDAAWFVAKALDRAQSADREAIKDAMVALVGEDFDGVLGEGLSWLDGSLNTPGVVVERTSSGDRLLYAGRS